MTLRSATMKRKTAERSKRPAAGGSKRSEAIVHFDRLPDRESYSAILQNFIDEFDSTPDSASVAIRMIATLLRSDLLPANGRDFLADRLESIVVADASKRIEPEKAFGLLRGSGAEGKENRCIAIFLRVEAWKCILVGQGVSAGKVVSGANKLAVQEFGLKLPTIKGHMTEARKRLRASGTEMNEVQRQMFEKITPAELLSMVTYAQESGVLQRPQKRMARA